jgi:Aldo/keto reductases, related to diketogulonate reductase
MGLEETFTLNNGVRMPKFGLGVYKSGDDTVQAVRWALEAGYRLIDTAAYYNNEVQVGKAVRESGIPREDIFVTTKMWNTDQRDDRQEDAFHESLNKLKLDYIDLYLIHWPVPGKFRDTWKYMEDFLASGKVRAIGVSNFLPHHLEELASSSQTVPAVDQFECNPLLTREELRAYCAEHGIQTEAWSPLGQGNALESRTIIEIAKKHRKTPAQIILRWDYQNSLVTIPKSIKQSRIVENAAIFNFTLSDEELEIINDLDTGMVKEDPDNFSF